MSFIRCVSDRISQKRFGVSYSHTIMENGEARFRISQEGYGYILTLAPVNGGWQNCHYHTGLRETYIVQKGWIIYATLEAGNVELKAFGPDSQFTTDPYVAHNIYMSVGTVIHTVKHGDASPIDRFEDKDAIELSNLLKNNWFGKEIEIAKASGIDTNGTTATPAKKKEKINIFHRFFNNAIGMNPRGQIDYTDAYMHFDNLIWQVPVWATAIFALAVGFENNIDLSTMFPPEISIGSSFVKCLLYSFLGITLLLLGYALFRFRAHQILSKVYVSRSWPFSPQSWLQFVVNIESGILILFGIKSIYSSKSLINELKLILVISIIGIFITIIYEIGLKWISKKRAWFKAS